MLNILKVVAHIIRLYCRPQFLFPLIALWYKAPNPWRLIKEFLRDNIFITAFIYGVLTACVALYCYSAGSISALISVIFNSFLLLLSFPLILALFCRIHYKASSRINWRKTLAPAKDLALIWFITMLFTCFIGLFVILISKI
ncbi:MAG: hypothetical protein IJ218_03965 [Alphaproteobacteria bacterium]|nr:hypothetical protein [Alphaproteobacteria bacterium]